MSYGIKWKYGLGICAVCAWLIGSASWAFHIKSEDWGSKYLDPISLSVECPYGGNYSPDLKISGPFSNKIQSFVIIIRNKNIKKDPNVYWFITHIPVKKQSFESGGKKMYKNPYVPLDNSWAIKAYLGPCPVQDDKLQYYVLTVYGLDQAIPDQLTVEYNTNMASRPKLMTYIKKHTVESKSLIAGYAATAPINFPDGDNPA